MAADTQAHSVSRPDFHRDRSSDFYAFFDTRRRREIHALVADNPEIVDEHRTNPLGYDGPHSPVLQRVQNYLRTQPIVGKYCICTSEAWLEYRIGLIAELGAEPVVLDEPVFATEEEAMHGVFLRRLADLANAENPES
jgi:branched-chain amino acid transport system permease protein